MKDVNLKNVNPHVNNPHSNFDLSFKRKFCTQLGNLYPVCMIPVNPDERFSVRYDFVTRFAPFVSQVYQDYRMSVDFIFVPNRLIWRNFTNFMQGGYDGNQTFVHPYINFSVLRSSMNVDNPNYSIFNALDVPDNFVFNASKDNPISALPFFAYLRAYIDHFTGTDTPLAQLRQRLYGGENYLIEDGEVSQELIKLYAILRSGDPSFVPSSQTTLSSLFDILERLYPDDYFTTARSNPQLGPAMTIPIDIISTDSDGTSTFKLVDIPTTSISQDVSGVAPGNSNLISLSLRGHNITVNGRVFENRAEITDFYSAARIQELLSIYGFSGFDPDQAIAAEFGVKSRNNSSRRSNRFFHLSHDLSIGEVFSNSVNTGIPSGGDLENVDLPGVGTAVLKGNSGIDQSFEFYTHEDYGYLVGLVSVYPEAAYQQGLPRHFNRLDRFDYPHPKLANLGMQDIKVSEIFCGTDPSDYNDTFAYKPRYAEEKTGINRVNGPLQTDLQYMSAGRKFTNQPVFNDQFLRVDPNLNNINRTFNVIADLPYNQPVFCDFKMQIYANRPLPKYGLFQI